MPTVLSRRYTAVVLLTLLLLVALARGRTYDEPLERDLATYAVIGQELNRGRTLYTDLWDHKPPAIYATFALGQMIAGDGAPGVYFLNVLASAAALLGIWAVGRSLAGDVAGLFAAACWAVASGDLALQGNQPNTELFMNAAVSGFFALGLSLRGKFFDWPSVLGAGALLALASFYKPVAVVYGVAFAVVHALRPPAEPSGVRRALAQVGVLAAIGAAAWAATFGYFAGVGRYQDFWDAVFVFNRAYAGNIGGNLIEGLTPKYILPGYLHMGLPLLTLTCVGAALAGFKRPSRRSLLLLAWFAATILAVALPGQFHPHYFQLWLPPLCVGAGWGLARLAEIAGEARRRVLYLLGALVLGMVALVELPYYFLSPAEWSRWKYGPIFVQTERAGRVADELLAPGESLYQWGNEPGLYLYAKLSPPAGVMWTHHLRFGPLAEASGVRVLAQLHAAQPELVIVSTGEPMPAEHPIVQWISANYVALPERTEIPPFRFLARRGGALEERLHAGTNVSK